MKHNISILALLMILLWPIYIKAQEREYFRPGLTNKRDLYTRFQNYSVEDGLSNNGIRAIYQDHYGYLWIGTEEGLNKYDGYEFTKFYHHAEDSTSLSSNTINDIKEDIYGNLWIATNHGLNKYLRSTNKFQQYLADDLSEDALRNNYIRAILPDSLGFLWVSTHNGFLHKFLIKADSFIVYKYDNKCNRGGAIAALWKNNNKIWVLAGYDKTAIFNIETEQFEFPEDYHITAEKDKMSYSISDDQPSVIQDGKGNIYLTNAHAFGVVYQPKNKRAVCMHLPSIYTMLKDHEGNIWLGGYANGLLKYHVSENTLTRMVKNDNDPNSIPDNMVWTIYQDKSSNIWVGTRNGLAKYSPKQNVFKNIRHIANQLQTICSNDIKDIIQTKDSNIWVASNIGLDRLDLNYHHTRHYSHDNKKKNSLLSNKINVLYEDKEGTVWIGHWAGIGFDRYNDQTDNFSHFTLETNNRSADWYTGFTEDHQGHFYTAMWSGDALEEFDRKHGVFTGNNYRSIIKNGIINFLYYDGQQIWFNNFSVWNVREQNAFRHLSKEYEIRNSYKFYREGRFRYDNFKMGTYLNCINRFGNDLYLGTNSGLYRYEKNTEEIIQIGDIDFNINCFAAFGKDEYLALGSNDGVVIVNRLNGEEVLKMDSRTSPDILKDYKINSLIADRDKNLWFSTNSGLYQVQITSLKMKEFRIEQINQFSNKRIVKLAMDSKHKLWVATENGLYSFNPSTKVMVLYQTQNGGLSNNMINDIYIDGNDDVWLGTQRGLNEFHRDSGQFESWFCNEMDPSTLPNNMITVITPGADHHLFVGTNKGYASFNMFTGKAQRFDEADDRSLQHNLLICVLTDSKGYIWVGNDRGASVDRINPETALVTHFIDRPYDSSSYKGLTASFIFEDSRNRIWVGSDKGLNIYDAHKNNFSHLTNNEGLPTNSVSDMLEDDHGVFWISTSKGLVRYDELNESMRVYTKADGLSSDAFTSGAGTKIFSGELAFGSDKGITLFHPDKISELGSPARPIITKLYVHDTLKYGDLSEVKSVALNYEENNITFEFSNLDLVIPNKTIFAYQL